MRIGFYINHVASIRPQFGSDPEPALIAAMAEKAGVQAILVGWSAQNGLINERDIRLIRELVKGDMIIVAPLDLNHVEPIIKHKPDTVILTDPNWNGTSRLKPITVEPNMDIIDGLSSSYHSAGITVSLFIDPVVSEIKALSRSRVNGIVLNCDEYESASTDEDAINALDNLADVAIAAQKFDMSVSAGNGISYENIAPLAGIRFIDEVYLEQSLIGQALLYGLDAAVEKLLRIIHYNKNL